MRAVAGLLVVIFGDLQAVLLSDLLGVSHPRGDDMFWEVLNELGCSRSTHILKELRPRL